MAAPEQRTRTVAVLLGFLSLAALSAGYWFDGFAEPQAEAESSIRRHCVDCHNRAEQAGGLVLDPATLTNVGERAEVWEKVLRKVSQRAMPPPEQPRPDEREYVAIQSYLETELDTWARSNPNPGAVPHLRRLTRTEYTNAIRDLLALNDLPAELDLELLLPADNSASGFDNIAELLFFSAPIMQRYVNAAEKVSRLAVGDMRQGPFINEHRLSLQRPQDTHVPGLPIGTRGGLAIDSYFPLDADYLFTIELGRPPSEAHQLEVLIDGERIAQVAVEPGPGRSAGSKSIELRIPVQAGPAQVGVTFVERTSAFDESTLRVRRRGRGALLDIDHVTIAGPFDPSGPGQTPSRDRIFVCTPEERLSESACANEILSTLVRRAYRRPVTEADLEDLMPFYEMGRAEGGFELGIQRALERLLISPQFLYRIEHEPEEAVAGGAYPVSDLELASRLSFFLWSSIPDDELLERAADGRLRESAVLESQVRRMLDDPRASSLVTNFAAQWLFLGDIEAKDPDLFLYRNYDESLRAAFRREIELFVDRIFRGGGSILDLLSADYTFVNERLAEHYGMPHIVGSHFRRVSLPDGSPRAGLLGKGGILALTSYSTRTSPVLRGKYVLENLLASPPPPPPPDVPSLDIGDEDTDGGAGLTMREALARHRADPACAGCHYEMDAIGFALENFDAVGRWRVRDAGHVIDANSELPDGTQLDGIAGLRAHLGGSPERFVSAFTEKLLMYALGRNVQYYDAPAVRAIVRAAAENDYAFESIVTGIVESMPFQMRTTEIEESPL